jgi:hypothetical protein
VEIILLALLQRPAGTQVLLTGCLVGSLLVLGWRIAKLAAAGRLAAGHW